MKVLEKNRAIELRKEGKTYTEIQNCLPVSKSFLSYWLRNIKLTNEQLSRIRYKNEKIKLKFIKFNELKRKRAERYKRVISCSAAEEINDLSERELKLVGIALYWAEGYKRSRWASVSFTNSDPEMIKLMIRWFRVICETPDNKFRIRIQCHGIKKADEAEKYWSRITAIPLTQFTKPYIRISPSSKKKVGDLSPYGVCDIRISDVSLLTKIKGWIQGLGALSSSPV